MYQKIVDWFARRPQSRALLTRFIIYLVGVISAGTYTDIDWGYLIITLVSIVGVDLTTTKGAESETTPVGDPKLGAGKSIPPALLEAATKVAAYLPGPIPALFETLGVEGLWTAVRVAEKVLKRPLNEDELKQARDERLGA